MESAWRDVVEGLFYRDYWWTLAWNDIRSRYRRSKIGQFWITLSVALFVLGIGVVYAGIFGMKISDYLPRLTVSYIVWMFIASVLTGGCSTFIAASATMQQRLFPISVHAYRLVGRELLIFAHNAIVIVAVWVIFRVGLTPAAVLAIPGMAINAYIAFWLAMVLGIVSVRYRDIPPIIQHGDFRFALLVCSELTNISYRAALRGKVDALFVPEWNPDTETFNAPSVNIA